MQVRSTSGGRVIAAAAAGLTALALGACGSSGDDSRSAPGTMAAADAAPVADGAAQVAVTLGQGSSGDECRLDHATAAAGPVTFTVTNKDAASITEVELISDQRILGEKENLAPGLSPVAFTVTLGGGTYQVYCPGAATENQTFTVTGRAAASPTGDAASLLAEGASQYGDYAAQTLADMQTAVANLRKAVDSGDLAQAKKEYALARPFYEKVESAVEGFVLPGYKAGDNRGNLDYLIDMRASNLDPAVGWHGFHAVERDLYENGKITSRTKANAAELQANTKKLAVLAKTLTYKPEDLANGAAGLLEEVQSGKIKGEEERYSHLDLVDFAANVEGAQQAFAYLKPGMEKVDPALTNTIGKQFEAVDSALQKYRDSLAGRRIRTLDAAAARGGRRLPQQDHPGPARPAVPGRPEGGDRTVTPTDDATGPTDDATGPTDDATGPTDDATVRRHAVPRRRFFQGAVGGVALGALAAGGTAWGMSANASSGPQTAADDRDMVDLTRQHPFYDQPHPPGVQTEPQRHAILMTFDMIDGTVVTDLQTLLARWSAAISQLVAGKSIGQIQPSHAEAVAADTGEASGLDPASLTVTVGLGPDLFDRRYGLAAKRPRLLATLPGLPSDNLSRGLTGGDLSLQVCADDPQVCYHAVRNLARMARDTIQTRWTVIGFGRASAGKGQQTPRNLMGFKDGTRNIREAAEFERFVWLKDADWMTGGTYQVVRKIQMDIEIWDADRISDQETIFGRSKLSGAPLTGSAEFDTPRFTAKAKDGDPVIDPTAHIALAAHENNEGVKILRRSYNYTDGITDYGQLDAGLLFIAYMNDPKHFVRLQTKLGGSDLLNEYITHIGSGIFAVPPTPASGHYIGEQLFA